MDTQKLLEKSNKKLRKIDIDSAPEEMRQDLIDHLNKGEELANCFSGGGNPPPPPC